ncbi:MAG TPA: hypothetical protein DCS82_11235 [Rhodospirillaceae bacterium]|nr:hypothetical protein [Rhodospirillaceae bacterium]HAA93205.1 hypothetical protein [Rhodospirillaceae bacterium]HAT36282.1 hypothetical protein [Rhodospirillaceae bacterium]
MIRQLITIVLPLLLPTVIYFFWVWMARRHAEKHGTEAPGPESIRDAPWLWLGIGGCALVVVTLVTVPLVFNEASEQGQYVAPQYKDGKIVPGHYAK